LREPIDVLFPNLPKEANAGLDAAASDSWLATLNSGGADGRAVGQ
jgi:hypothetical protein